MSNGIINKTEGAVKTEELIGGYKLGTICYFYGTYAKVYSLSDKHGNVFYIGLTGHPIEKRLLAHIAETKSCKIKGSKKIEKIKSLNYEVYISIIEMVWTTGRTHREAVAKIRSLESQTIQTYKSLGYELTNRTKEVGLPKLLAEEYKGQCLAFINGIVKEITKSKS